ncbi:hypothetical protein ACCE111639_12965 [Acinetobacter celticus]
MAVYFVQYTSLHALVKGLSVGLLDNPLGF